MDPDPSGELQDLQGIRRRRAELRDSLVAVESALASPAPGRLAQWTERVCAALMELSADFREHVVIAEAPDGINARALRSAPRLAKAVDRLQKEHAELAALMDQLLMLLCAPGATTAEQVRDDVTRLLGRLVRHRQRGSDLLYEAWAVDIGGGD
jgi:sugar phosphate isomerase/epimerase